MFKDTKEGQTHYENDGCGESAHNKYQIEDIKNKIINGDCLKIISKIPDGSIDLVLTDPPYKIQFNGKGSLGKKFDYRKKDIQGIGSNPNFKLENFLETIRLKMKKMNMYVWMAKGSIPETIDWIRKYNYFWDLLVWSKINPIPAYNYKYLSDLEYCFFIREKGSHWTKKLNYQDYKKTMIDKVQSLKGHPTPKPLWMMEKLIKVSSKEGDLILDPFMGSGTTAIAAKKLNRNYIGIELNKDYCKLAELRIKKECPQKLL